MKNIRLFLLGLLITFSGSALPGAGQQSLVNYGVTGVVTGQQAYTTAGTYSWTAPAGVTSVSVVCVGAGGDAGGALAYKNSITVVPGNSYTVIVPVAKSSSRASFNGSGVVSAGQGNSRTGDGGGNGGARKGGGAGGYAGAGGDAAITGADSFTNGNAGAGGGGGGGGSFDDTSTSGNTGSSAGGGVGLFGQGPNGAGGVATNTTSSGGGKGGSSGTDGGLTDANTSTTGTGGTYGGSPGVINGAQGIGVDGAVRIIWPGTTRSFPTTNTGAM